MILPFQLFNTEIIRGRAVLIFLFCLPSPSYAEWTEWLIDVETLYTFQDNINHAMFSGADEDEQVWSGLASIGRAYQITDNTRFISRMSVDGHVHNKFDQLDQLSTNIDFSIRHKLGLGAFQPWIRGAASTGYIFSSSQIRQGQTVAAGIDLGKALDERLDVILSYRFDYRNNTGHSQSLSTKKLKAATIDPTTSNNVFDLKGHSVGVQINTLLTQQWLVAFSYSYRRGDIVSSSIPSLVPQINSIVDAISFDDALEGWAYRSKADTHRYSIDTNYAFMKGHGAVNLGFEHTESTVNSFAYRNNLFRINLNYRF